ncbi:hypothetical protein ACP4OV_023655 [Aristida adscensionis]
MLSAAPASVYRDSIRRVSLSGGGLRRSVQSFFPAGGSDTAADEWSYCSSSASSASSPAMDASASARRSPVSVYSSSSSDAGGIMPFVSDPAVVRELHAIARQMVCDGYMQHLVRAFGVGGGASSAHHGGRRPDDDERLLESLFWELDVEWILHVSERGVVQLLQLKDGCVSLQDLMERWIRALKTMVQLVCIMQLEFRAMAPADVSRVWKAIQHFFFRPLAAVRKVERELEVAQFARLTEVSILKMLTFVDAATAAAAALDDRRAPETLPGMLQVYTCVVEDLPTVPALFKETSSTATMTDAMNVVFMCKREKLSEAIWSVMEKARASFLTDDCWQVSPEAAAEGIHESSRVVMKYITMLVRNEDALNFVLQDHRNFTLVYKSGSEPDDSSSVVNLIKDIISGLEKHLEKASNAILEPGLRYIFLMNNYSFVSKKVSSLLLPSWIVMEMEDRMIEKSERRNLGERPPPMKDYINQPDPNLEQEIERDSNLDGLVKIQRYIEAYLDVSWRPVVSCLLCHGFRSWEGALAKFESKFQRTYAEQKLWKAPNPELRKKLRKAVIEEVVLAYSKAERTARGKRNRTFSRTSLELEKLLEDLFEG